LSKAYTKGPIRKLSFILNGIAKIADEAIMGNAEFVLVSGDVHAKFIKALLHSVRIVFLSPGHAALPKIPSQRGSYLFAATAWKEGKRIEDLLKIVANIKEINLKIAGRWIHKNYRKRIMSIVTRMGLTKRVAILGEVSEKELNKYYSGARVAIGVNNERGFGLVALEAASNGCPFIITKDSGATKYFKGDVDGFYYDYGDLNSLEKYMQKLITDERLAYNMGKHAWETVRNKYTWQKHAQNLLQEILKT
jgi:glycosyltransferase involved in cell wall biosynthesis